MASVLIEGLTNRVLKAVVRIAVIMIIVLLIVSIVPAAVSLGVRIAGGQTGGDLLTGVVEFGVKVIIAVAFYIVTLKMLESVQRSINRWGRFWRIIGAMFMLYITEVVKNSLGLNAYPEVSNVLLGISYASLIIGLPATLLSVPNGPRPRDWMRTVLTHYRSAPLPKSFVGANRQAAKTTLGESMHGLKSSRLAWSHVSRMLTMPIPVMHASLTRQSLTSVRLIKLPKVLVELVEGLDLEGSECSPIGCGGWGCVYACTLKRNSSFALKVHRILQPVLEGGGLVMGEMPTIPGKLLRKIKLEAEAIKILDHPNLVKLLAYSTRAPIVVYELVEGGALRDRIKLLRGDYRSVTLLGIQAGDALRYMHSRGLVHGDLKPSNVLLVKEGYIKVGDYSSIRKLLEVTSTTRETVACTPGYCAPEQVFSDLAGRAGEAGMENRADIYQLGNLMLEALTGNVIDGEEVVKNPRNLRDSLSLIHHKTLRELLSSMLNPDPLMRPSAEEVVKELVEIYESL